MAMLLPRLQVSDETIARLRLMAEERGVSVGVVIVELVEEGIKGRRLEAAVGDRETLFRILLAGERAGMKVGGTSDFPSDWVHHGRLSPDLCRKVAASYKAWRQKRDGARQAGRDGP